MKDDWWKHGDWALALQVVLMALAVGTCNAMPVIADRIGR